MSSGGGSTAGAAHEPGGDSCSLLVSLPLLVPYGVVVKQDTSASAVYAFSSQFPSARALLSRSSDTCDMFVGQLQVDLVSFSCKRSQVAQVAGVFNRMARKKLQQLFERPIYIRCEGLKQRSVSTVAGGVPQVPLPHDVFIGSGQQRVYFTAVDVLTNEDREKFWAIESFVESYVEKLKELRLLNSKTVARTPDLFVVVRRFLSDPLPHPLNHYSQYQCDGVQLSEVRLVFSKGTSQCPVKHVKIDPRFKNVEISCRPIVCDSDGRPARHEFAPAILPVVFPSAQQAAKYLESLDSYDGNDRDAREALLEADSRSGSSDRGEHEVDDAGESTVESLSMYSPGIRSVRDDTLQEQDSRSEPLDQPSSPATIALRGRRRPHRSSCSTSKSGDGDTNGDLESSATMDTTTTA